MYGFKFLISRLGCDQMRRISAHTKNDTRTIFKLKQIRSYVTRRVVNKPVEPFADNIEPDENWPRKIFSGIQPTGELHLGNYLGAVRKWTQLQQAREDVTYCIVDMHSITLPQDPATLRENIFKIAATLLACGINPTQSTLFVQSAVKEHGELCWLLNTICTMARLAHLPQYKEKTRQIKDIPLGLFVYPVLQAADILLYKATHVPVGEDQVQHIQLTQHLAKTFNSRFGQTFPICHALIENKEISRIRSLRDPLKKMSKSDTDPKSAIYMTDDPDTVVEKVKKAVTDFSSDVSYDPEERPGVSNLIVIHSQVSGQTIEEIISEARSLDTGKYKLRVAESINEHLKPIREKVKQFLDNRSQLSNVLESGAEKARNIAFDTIEEVKHRMGLGAPYIPLYLSVLKPAIGNIDHKQNKQQQQAPISYGTTPTIHTPTAPAVKPIKAILETKQTTLEMSRKLSAVLKPAVPQQRLRIEKDNYRCRLPISSKLGKKAKIVSNITSELLQKDLLKKSEPKDNTDELAKHDITMRIRRLSRSLETLPPSTIVLPVTTEENQQKLCGCKNKISSQTANQSDIEVEIDASQAASQNNVGESVNTTACNLSLSASSPVPSVSVPSTPSPSSSPSPSPLSQPFSTTTTSSSSSSTVIALPVSVSPSSSSTSLSAPKTTLPAPCATANSNSSEKNVEQLTHNNITATALAATTSTRTTKTTATINPMTMKTFKRTFQTTTPQGYKKENVTCEKQNQPTQKYGRKIIERTLFYGLLTIGVVFGGVYYFWRSVLQTFFDIKKSGGD